MSDQKTKSRITRDIVFLREYEPIVSDEWMQSDTNSNLIYISRVQRLPAEKYNFFFAPKDIIDQFLHNSRAANQLIDHLF